MKLSYFLVPLLMIFNATPWQKIRTSSVKNPDFDLWKQDIKITFDDIIGKEDIKQELQRIVSYINDHEPFDRAGINPAPLYLIYGPPKSGKSIVVKSLGGEIQKILSKKGIKKPAFLPVPCSMVKEKGFAWVMAQARALVPCVVFIDEIHLVIDEIRSLGWQNDVSKKVIIIGTTNNHEFVGEISKRNGRFGKYLYSGYPNSSERLQYLKRDLNSRNTAVDTEYLEKLAGKTHYCTFEDLGSMVACAVQNATFLSEILTEKHLEMAFDRKGTK